MGHDEHVRHNTPEEHEQLAREIADLLAAFHAERTNMGTLYDLHVHLHLIGEAAANGVVTLHLSLGENSVEWDTEESPQLSVQSLAWKRTVREEEE